MGHPPWLSLGTLSSSLLTVARAADEYEYTYDPYLEYRPAFAHSLPVQILATGVVLTLVAVLFIHLIFTAQYHWPLAPVNYVLQMSAVSTLLISLISTLHVVISSTVDESQRWPYMLSYIAVNIPPADLSGWNVGGRAAWLVMNAATSGLIQITHIQFLTLLYPSRLEGRLIFTLLGPLAIVAAVMQLIPLQGNGHINDLADAIRNVCNATLSLLFTISLFIWGFLVNRRQAWRLDGGTAVFGASSLTLALVSTALTFLYVPVSQEYAWLPGLIWAVVLWQSFLGWWWWVGADTGGARTWGERDAQDALRRREKRAARRREREERRRETKERVGTVLRGVKGAFGRAQDPSDSDEPDADGDGDGDGDAAATADSVSVNTNTTVRSAPSTHSAHSAHSAAPALRFLPPRVRAWLATLRRAHVAAARAQAAERRALAAAGSGTPGWGLGAFGGAGAAARVPGPGAASVWWWGPLRRWRMKDATAY